VEEGAPEAAANMMICLVHQANYLLDRQLRRLEATFLAGGGFTERLHGARRAARATRGPNGGEGQPRRVR
jgi:four helix bundle suffix protein